MTDREIWVIGTEPPCPRCGHLTRMVQEIVAENGLDVRVRHLAYTDDAAADFAATLGLIPGTAKDVAKKTTVDVDWERVFSLVTPPPEPAPNMCCGDDTAPWTPELDEALRPCREKAVEAGILMTPVLVVAGEMKHSGSVPEREQVRDWIVAAFPKENTTEKIVIEVLGPGCRNCDTLYENVHQALDMTGLADRFRVVKMQDMDYFIKKGIVTTPSLIIGGEVVSVGRVLGPDQLAEKLKARM
jgi:hypothetical protein